MRIDPGLKNYRMGGHSGPVAFRYPERPGPFQQSFEGEPAIGDASGGAAQTIPKAPPKSQPPPLPPIQSLTEKDLQTPYVDIAVGIAFCGCCFAIARVCNWLFPPQD